MKPSLAIIGFAMLLLSACSNQPDAQASDRADGDDTQRAETTCPDDGDRLPITGICAGRAVVYLNAAGGDLPEAPEGCEWVVQETRFNEDVLLYRATQCGEKTTRLTFADGAGIADLSYDTAAYGDAENALKGEVLVRVTGADESNKTANLLRVARGSINGAAERSACKVRNARIDFWPDDALVIDSLSPREAAEPSDGPRTACGPFGLDENSSTFWRVFQGHSWFFRLGQDVWQVDPGSFTLMRKGEDGKWMQAE
ncbi:hypothetical protein [Alteriqipengyuania sp.]|uniref:hypothetical protein n=1 Tax=Alteriqipengyuania sp. TaxID=2800692 RepID=UPI003511F658